MKTQMKTIKLVLMVVCIALSLQCSDDSGNTDEILGPTKDIEEALDDKNSDLTDESNTDNLIVVDGISNISNARLVVNNISSFQVTEGFEYFESQILGESSPGPVEGSNTSRVYLSEQENAVYIEAQYAHFFSLLGVTDGFGINGLSYWDLVYSVVEEVGVKQEISITGSGKGSHIFYDCWTNNETLQEFLERNDITFEFQGTLMEGTNTYFQGSFSINETSTDGTCMLSCSGTTTLILD